MRKFLIAFAFFLLAHHANAATYYVAINGKNQNPGTLQQPFRTIARGTSALAPGDTLYIRGGVYDEQIPSSVPGGRPGQHTVVSGYESENPIIQPVRDYAGGSYAVYSFGQSGFDYITWRNFTIDLSLVTTAVKGTIDGSVNCLLLVENQMAEGITCKDSTRTGIGIFGDNIVVRNNTILDCGRVNVHPTQAKGLGIHGSGSNVIIENNLISGCRGGGVQIDQWGPATNVHVRNNIIRHFGTDATWLGPDDEIIGASGITLAHGSYMYAYNNVIYNTHYPTSGTPSYYYPYDSCFGAWGDNRGDGSVFYFFNNTCHLVAPGSNGMWSYDIVHDVVFRNNVYSGITDVRGDAPAFDHANYTINPTFVNLAAEDFHLAPGSAGIDEGIDLSAYFQADFYGVPRPQNGRWDMGAFEYNGSWPMPTPGHDR